MIIILAVAILTHRKPTDQSFITKVTVKSGTVEVRSKEAEPVRVGPGEEVVIGKGRVSAAQVDESGVNLDELTARIEELNAQIESLKAELAKETRAKEDLLKQLEEILANTGIRGHVYDNERNPVEGATVYIGLSPELDWQTAMTNFEGYYEIRSLSIGSYSVSCDLYPEEVANVHLKYGEILTQNFDGKSYVKLYGHVYYEDAYPFVGHIMLRNKTTETQRTEIDENGVKWAYCEYCNTKQKLTNLAALKSDDGIWIICKEVIVCNDYSLEGSSPEISQSKKENKMRCVCFNILIGEKTPCESCNKNAKFHALIDDTFIKFCSFDCFKNYPTTPSVFTDSESEQDLNDWLNEPNPQMQFWQECVPMKLDYVDINPKIQAEKETNSQFQCTVCKDSNFYKPEKWYSEKGDLICQSCIEEWINEQGYCEIEWIIDEIRQTGNSIQKYLASIFRCRCPDCGCFNDIKKTSKEKTTECWNCVLDYYSCAS